MDCTACLDGHGEVKPPDSYHSSIYSPTDAPLSCLKNNIKIYIKTAVDMFRCYSYTIIRERISLCLLKLQLLKQSIKIRRCVVNTVVVWLQILGH